MNVKTLLCAAIAASLLAAGAARADTPIYKWVDEKGQVHYSTEPHSDKAQQLSIQNTATPHAGTGVTPAPATSTDVYANDAKLVLPQADDSPECKGARDILFKYLHSDQMYNQDDKGNKVTVSAEEKARVINEARKYVKATCGGGA